MKFTQSLSAIVIALGAITSAHALDLSSFRPYEMPSNISQEKTLNEQIKAGKISDKYHSPQATMVERHGALCGSFDQPVDLQNPLKVEVPSESVSRVHLEINYQTVNVVCKQRNIAAVKAGVTQKTNTFNAVIFTTPDGKEVRKCVNSCMGNQPQ
jgi:hypothetical protein